MNVTPSALWTLATKDEFVLGLPTKGGVGEIAGQIAVTDAPSAHNTGNAGIGQHKYMPPLFVSIHWVGKMKPGHGWHALVMDLEPGTDATRL